MGQEFSKLKDNNSSVKSCKLPKFIIQKIDNLSLKSDFFKKDLEILSSEVKFHFNQLEKLAKAA